jgi:nitrous oxide reductase
MSESQSKPSRRGFMVGAAVAGAATAAVAVATLPKTATPEAAASAQKPPVPENGGGYHVSEHVKRYYKSTLV